MAKGAQAHPSYLDMITEAIVALKDRNGSSLAALKKHIGTKWNLPDGWDKKLHYYLKKLTSEGKLVKVRASWKLAEGLRKTRKVSAKRPQASVVVKPKAKAVRPKVGKAKAKADGGKAKTAVIKKGKPKVLKKKVMKKAVPKMILGVRGKIVKKAKAKGSKTMPRKTAPKPKDRKK